MILTKLERISNTAFELIAVMSGIWKLNYTSLVIDQLPELYATSENESIIFNFREMVAQNAVIV